MLVWIQKDTATIKFQSAYDAAIQYIETQESMRLLTGEPVKGMEKLAQSVRGPKDLELDVSSDSVTRSAHSQETNALSEKMKSLVLPIQAMLGKIGTSTAL